jgi:UDP:flavonoid glycosyltransferase YjiC (YdhE family)
VIAQERSILSVVRNTEGMDGVIVCPHDGTLGIPNVAAMVTGWAGDDGDRAFQQLEEGLSSITADELHRHGFHFSVEDTSSPASVHTWPQHFAHEPIITNSGAGEGSVPPSASPLLRGTEAQVRAPLRVTCFLPAFNAGETTRGIELCRGLVAQARGREREVTVRLAYSTSDPDYEAQIIASGFEAHRLALHLDEATVSGIMAADHDAAEHVSDLGTARRFIQAVMDEIIASTPDLVVCGFVPPVGIAAQILQVPAVVYLPFPAYRPWVRGHLLKDIPDDLDNALTSSAPAPVRRLFAKLLSAAMLTKGFFKQPTFAAAGRELGWRVARPDLFAMLAAPLQVVTDLPASYQGQHVGPNTRITGPLFSLPPDVEVASAIREMFSPGPHNRVFVSMGSSGEKPYLLAAVEALATMQVRAVVVVAPRICSLEEVRQSLPIPSHILLTDSFVPAHQVNAMADAAVIHGGQGTVQTAVSAGTPIVGVGMQVEQSTNLDNVVHRGAGIRIPKRHWTPERIRRALGRVLELPSFQQSAARLKCEHDAIDGRKEVARAIWEFVDSSAL